MYLYDLEEEDDNNNNDNKQNELKDNCWDY
jgi:hypothetical protein